MKNVKLIFITTILTLLISSANSAQKDCSVYTHAFDRTICEKRNTNAENSNDTTMDTSGSSGNKVSGFFNKFSDVLKLKKHKKLREAGDN